MSDQPVLDPRAEEIRGLELDQDSRRSQRIGVENPGTFFIGVRVPQRDGRRRRSKRQRSHRGPHTNEAEKQNQPQPTFGSLAATVAAKSPDPVHGDPSARVHFLLDNADDEEQTGDEQIHPMFCQMNELAIKQDEPEWREAARWIKFEEAVEEGGARWSKPHVATLSLLSLFELRNALCSGEALLESEAQSVEEIADLFIDRLLLKNKLQLEVRDELKQLLMKKHRNLNEKKLTRTGSFLGTKIRSFAELGRRNSSKDLERDGQQSSGATLGVKNSSSVGLQEMGEGDSSSPADLQTSQSGQKFDHSFMRKIPPGAETANILVGNAACLKSAVAAFIRLRRPVVLHDVTEVPVASRFIFILLEPADSSSSYRELGRCMGTLMSDDVFKEVAYQAKTKEDLLAGIDEFLKFCIVLPPNEWDPSIRIEPPNEVPSQDSRRQASSASLTASAASAPAKVADVASDRASQSPNQLAASSQPPGAVTVSAEEEGEFDDSLERTGRLFGGLIADIKRKTPYYLSDFKDAFHVQTIGAFFFIYFACLTPIITFGGLLTDATEGNLGAIESIVAGCICGVTFTLLSGQPLTILGSTGPVLVFETIVFKMCKEWEWDYLGFRLWIGLWLCGILILFVAFDLSALVKYITRFTEESFAALIALIFIVEAIKKQLSILKDYPIDSDWLPGKLIDLNCSCDLASSLNESDFKPLEPGKQFALPSYQRSFGPNATRRHFINHSALTYWDWESTKNQKACKDNQGQWFGSGCGTYAVPDVFLFSCLLFIATYSIGYGLKAMRNSRYFPNRIRASISDFAIMIAIVSMTALDYAVGLHTPKLQVPEKFSPTLGYDTRGWVVAPFGRLGQNPWYTAIFAILPALLATILMFMDQQITAVIVNRKDNKLRKGVGYHLDLLIVAVLIGINSVLGIPWFVAATVLSINHVMSLKIESESSAPGERPKFLGCRENRLMATLIFLTIGLSIFLTPILKHIPLSVLYGVFLFMGVSSLRGVQLMQRVALFLMPHKYQPDYKFLRHVKTSQVHKFTVIQVVSLVLLWAVKTVKQISILFPVMVLAMCFIRKALDFVFTQHELKWLDAKMPEFSLKANVKAKPDTDIELKLSEQKKQQRASGSEGTALLGPVAPEIVVDPPSGRASPVKFH